MAVVTDRIGRAFSFSGANFVRAWHAGLPPKLKFSGVSVKLFRLISSFFSGKRLCVSLYGKTSSRRAVNAGVPRVQFLDQLSSFGTSTIFLIIFCVKLLFKLVILLSNQNVTDLLNIRRRLRWILNKNWILIRQWDKK